MDIMHFFDKYNKVLFVLLGATFVLVTSLMPLEGVIVAFGILFVLMLYKNPKVGVLIMLISLPLANTKILAMQPISKVPFKLFVLLYLLLFGMIFIRYKMNLHTAYDYQGLLIILLYFALFTISIFKATAYMDSISSAWDDDFSLIRMINNFWITPTIMLVPALTIFLYFNYEEYHKIISGFITMLLILSITVIFIYVFVIPNKTNFDFVRDTIGSYLGLHGNGIADFYIIAFPILFVNFMNNGNLISKVSFYLSMVAIAVLFSRTAYICTILTIVAYNLYRRKLDGRFASLVIAASIVVMFLPQSVIDRFSTLSTSGRAIDLTAGRTADIWAPLWAEWLHYSDSFIWFGKGRFMIVDSFVYRNGVILKVAHPHNMFLEALTDIGIIGTGIYFIIFGWFIYHGVILFFKKDVEQYDRDVIFGIVLSFGLFCLSGLSGRTMFPSISNVYMWVMMMMSVIIIRHYKEGEPRWAEEE